MTECLYPHNTGQTAYWKGCRCDRCREAKSKAGANRVQRPRFTCTDCGLPVRRANSRCMLCAYPPAIDVIMSKIVVNQRGCWVWPGPRFTPDGYGLLDSKRTVSRVVHRVTYTWFVGPVPDGLQLDHLCRERTCCNPDHLEAVTPKENVRRSLAARRGHLWTA